MKICNLTIICNHHYIIIFFLKELGITDISNDATYKDSMLKFIKNRSLVQSTFGLT